MKWQICQGWCSHTVVTNLRYRVSRISFTLAFNPTVPAIGHLQQRGNSPSSPLHSLFISIKGRLALVQYLFKLSFVYLLSNVLVSYQINYQQSDKENVTTESMNTNIFVKPYHTHVWEWTMHGTVEWNSLGKTYCTHSLLQSLTLNK